MGLVSISAEKWAAGRWKDWETGKRPEEKKKADRLGIKRKEEKM